jgi:hypothetical protein
MVNVGTGFLIFAFDRQLSAGNNDDDDVSQGSVSEGTVVSFSFKQVRETDERVSGTEKPLFCKAKKEKKENKDYVSFCLKRFLVRVTEKSNCQNNGGKEVSPGELENWNVLWEFE